MTKETENSGCCGFGRSARGDDCCLDEVGSLVQKLVRIFQMFERDQIRFFGFTSSQCYVLLEILKSTDVTMNELSERMNLDTSTMTRVVDTLVRNGYVTRHRSGEDRRVMIVSLTETGREEACKLRDSVNSYYKKIIENLPEGNVEEVLNSVSLLIDAFRKANPNCC